MMEDMGNQGEHENGEMINDASRESHTRKIRVLGVATLIILAGFAAGAAYYIINENGKYPTMLDIVKEYDRNGDGHLSNWEITHAELKEYYPGEKVTIRDVIYKIDGVWNITQYQISQFEEGGIITPANGIKPGIYTMVRLKSLVDYANETGDSEWYHLSYAAIPGNITGKYSAGDTITFTTEIVRMDDHKGNSSEFTAALLLAVAVIWYLPQPPANPLVMSLTYLGDESTSSDVFLQVSMSQPESSAFEKVDVELDDYANRTGTGGYLNSSGEMLLELEGHNYTVRVLDMDKNGVLSSGDRIEICSDTGTLRNFTISVWIEGYDGDAELTIPS